MLAWLKQAPSISYVSSIQTVEYIFMVKPSKLPSVNSWICHMLSNNLVENQSWKVVPMMMLLLPPLEIGLTAELSYSSLQLTVNWQEYLSSWSSVQIWLAVHCACSGELTGISLLLIIRTNMACCALCMLRPSVNDV